MLLARRASRCAKTSPARPRHAQAEALAEPAGSAALAERSRKFGAAEGEDGIIRCDACPVLCRIRPGRAGACSRYANENGLLVRTDPVVLLAQAVEDGQHVVPFGDPAQDWDGSLISAERSFVTGIGSGTTYPDYKPAPFIVSSTHEGVDTVTVVTEGIFSYCGVKVKIDTDRHLGPETAGGPRQWRADRPCHHRRIRLADALHRRRPPSHRRLEEGRQRHLRGDDEARQWRGGRADHRWRPWRDRPGRPGADRRRQAGDADARRLRARRPSASSRSNGRGMSTR